MSRRDPFFYDQPPLKFVDELKKPYYEKAPKGYNTRKTTSVTGVVRIGGLPHTGAV